MERDAIAESVLHFYQSMPFNTAGSLDAHIEGVLDCDPFAMYPPLDRLCGPGTRVLEVGCGTGWFSQALALRRHCRITAIDFNPVAIERAQAAERRLASGARFEVANLFAYRPEAPFDLVLSLGVLHHTGDCRRAVSAVCAHVRPGGRAFIGLYHLIGRRPFLDHLERARASGMSDDEMRGFFAALHPAVADDPVLLESWVRDQMLHPHETQHTLAEMASVLGSACMVLEGTSLNGYAPLTSGVDLDSLDRSLGEKAEARLSEDRYFPGFFTMLARRQG